jgi:hypothetical protein
MRRLPALALVLALSAAAAAEPVSSPTGRLRFVPGPGAQGLAQSLARTGDDDRDAAAREVGRDWDGVTEVRVALDAPSFRAALPRGASVPEWAAGVAFPEQNLVVLRAFPGSPEGRATLRHELSHVAVGRLAAGHVPRWFLEGLATLQAGDAWSRQGPSLVRAALGGRLFRLQELSEGFPAGAGDAELAYAMSADFLSWLVERSGGEAVRGLLADVVGGTPFEAAAAARFGAGTAELEQEWSRSLARWELFARVATQTEIWWVLLAALLALGALRVRARRHALLEEMAREEESRELAAFAEAPGYWADGPSEQGPAGGGAPEEAAPADVEEPGPEAAPEASEAGSPEAGEDDEDELPYFVGRNSPTTKKPTIH